MEAYLAYRIELGKLKYTDVVAKYPQFKTGIDEILVADGYGNLIVE